MIQQAAVLGAGVMGAQIAAHLINAKVPVILFDLPSVSGPSGSKNTIVTHAVERLQQLSPAPLASAALASMIEVANYDDDLDRLKECDLLIEAIAERMDLKHALYQRIATIAPFLRPNIAFTSNTSGLSVTSLADALPESLKPRFCGMHFFNPPRYMHLVELIPTPDTDADLLNTLEIFLTRTLGKGVVRAKDTPNFIANRVGVFSMLATMAEAEKLGLDPDLVDDLTGSRLGRAKSATFRTADIVGLDTIAYVVETLQRNLANDPFFPVYQTPQLMSALITRGHLGQKSQAGFYRKEGGVIKRFELAPGHYVDAGQKADPLIARILKRAPGQRLQLLRESPHPQAQFLWAIFRDVFHYAAVHLEAIASSTRDIDLAIRWGFSWNEGPFETWQAAGWQQVAQWIKADIEAGAALARAPLPDWVFDAPVARQGVYSPAEGEGQLLLSWSPMAHAFIPPASLNVSALPAFHTSPTATSASALGRTLIEDNATRAWVSSKADDDIVILSFKTKMNTIGAEVLDGLARAVELAEKDHQGLVIWQPDSLKAGMPGPFSAGADLKSMMPAFAQKGASGIEPIVCAFQQTMLRVKYAQVPVISAIAGLALGGGCELALASAARVAHLESYMGLVESGVGLLPAGGGLKEAALRAAQGAHRIGKEAGTALPLIDYLITPFQTIAMAKVSSSALQAVEMGYLEPSDPIVLNIDALLAAAIRRARVMAAEGWRPALPARTISVAGRDAIATFRTQLVNLREGEFISEHDFLIASRIAEVLCGGDVEAGSLVDEAWLLALERRAFVELLATPKTQARIVGMLQTGKPVRN